MRAVLVRRLPGILRDFARGNGGGLVVEAVIVLPFLIWAFVALFVFWDVYRTINVVQKSSYAMADFLSRQRTPVNAAFIGGMEGAMNFMLDGDQPVTIRVTSLQWVSARNRYEVLWSHSPGNALPRLTTTTLAVLKDRLPIMANGDTVVLFEARLPYVPTFNIGLEPRILEQFIFTRPRFSPRIEWSTS